MKKTIKKRAFISAIAMLIVSAIVLTSSTFAWFSMAKTGTVDMDLTIASPDGIQISANTTAFTTSLTKADFDGTSGKRYVAYADNQNNFPDNLSPVSSAFRIAANSLPKFYSGSINEAGRCNASLVSDELGANFVVFDVFIQLASATNVSITNTTITCEENPEVVTAMRIATVNCGVVSKGATATDILATKPAGQTVSSTNVAQMIEPKKTEHTATAIERGATASTTTYYLEAGVTNGPCDPTFPNIYNHAAGTQCASSYASTIGTIKAQAGVNRIRVYIWMEGQDVDCANDVAGASLKVNLSFDI